MDRHIGSTSNNIRGSRISEISYDSDDGDWDCHITTTAGEFFSGSGDSKGEALSYALDYWDSYHSDFKNQSDFDEHLKILRMRPPPPSEAELQRRCEETVAIKSKNEAYTKIVQARFSYIFKSNLKIYGWLAPLFIWLYIINSTYGFSALFSNISFSMITMFIPVINWLVILAMWATNNDGSSIYFLLGIFFSIIVYFAYCSMVKISRS